MAETGQAATNGHHEGNGSVERLPAGRDLSLARRAVHLLGLRPAPATGREAVQAGLFWRDARRRRMLAGADFLAGALTAALAISALASGSYLVFLAAPLWVLLAKLFGLYDADHRAIRHKTEDELSTIAGVAALGTVFLIIVDQEASGERVPPLTAVSVWLVATLGTAMLRGAARYIWRRITSPEQTAVIGDQDLVRAFARKVWLLHDMHVQLVEIDPAFASGDEVPPASILSGVDRVVLASSTLDARLINALTARCRATSTKLSVACALTGSARPAHQLSQVAEIPVLEYNTWNVSRTTLVLKRCFDLAVAGVLLAVALPLLVAISLAIRIESKGPILFRQRRVGMQGQEFAMLKFRSMVVDAEERLALADDLDELKVAMTKPAEDPRVTTVGRLLRRSSLDELPQFVNVLKGDMSIVGPRPEKAVVVEHRWEEFSPRLQVRPGITGPMQVQGRAHLTFDERAALEIEYVEQLSFARDLKVLAMTPRAAVRGTGAF